MSILSKRTCLRLNANYMRLGWCSAQEAFGMLCGEQKDGSPPAMALDIQYEYDEYGKPITDKMVSFDRLPMDEWMTLTVRRGDLDCVVHTAKRIIRIPTVILCPKYAMMPSRDIKPTAAAIRRRDGNKCQYTNVELTRENFSLDHVIPKSRWKKMGKTGSPDNWENLVAADRNFNSKKGNALNSEIGARLLKTPVAPKRMAICNIHTEVYHPDHKWF